MRDHHGARNLAPTLELLKPGARVRRVKSSSGPLDQDTLAETTTNRGASEIVRGDVSGGTNTSQTILIDALAALLEAVAVGSERREYESAAIDGNVLGKQTLGSRRRTFRHLRELYLLRPDSILFRAMRDLWPDDSEARPLLAGLCALARDAVFRASSDVILRAAPGDPVAAGDLAGAVGDHFPTSYGGGTLAKIGRNCFSSWHQMGHLGAASKATRLRKRVACRQTNVAYALLLGHLQGIRGEPLFETVWAKMLDQPKSQLFDLAHGGSQRGLIEFRRAGGVIEVGFRELLRSVDGEAH